MPEIALPKLYTVEEVAQLLNKSTSYVYMLIWDGLLTARVRKGNERGYVIKEQDILDFYENGFEEVAHAK